MSAAASTRGPAGAGAALCVALAVLALAGCAQHKPLYDWGPYPQQVYEHLKGGSPAEQIAALEAHRERVRAAGGVLPPGYEAHLAMLYGEAGQDDRFAAGLMAEKQAFPESGGFIDYLLGKFKRPAR